jgi:hypothetical protein
MRDDELEELIGESKRRLIKEVVEIASLIEYDTPISLILDGVTRLFEKLLSCHVAISIKKEEQADFLLKTSNAVVRDCSQMVKMIEEDKVVGQLKELVSKRKEERILYGEFKFDKNINS